MINWITVLQNILSIFGGLLLSFGAICLIMYIGDVIERKKRWRG